MVGTAVHGYKDGRYSKYVPTRMRQQFEQSVEDADLLSLRREVSLCDARLADLLSRVDTGESGALWDNLKKAYEEFKLYRLAGNTPENVRRMTVALARIETVIGSAIQDHLAWGEIAILIEQRRKLAESQNKQEIASQQLLRVDQALLMMHNMIDIVTRHVLEIGPRQTPQQALSAIIVDMQQMAGHAVPTYAEPEVTE